jgi:hypothetical protein
MSHRVDITGQRFGRLVALRRDGRIGHDGAWLCRCDCGAERRVQSGRLRKGHTKSCGCWKSDTVKARWKLRGDITGRTFGRLTVLRRDENFGEHSGWLCECACGKTRSIPRPNLVQGFTRSCGCLNAELASARRLKHGQSKGVREYRIWCAMKARCTYPKSIRWMRYGGRGITVCERWLHSFEAFLADMGPCPSPKHSIDRVNNDGNYEVGNVRWATSSEQAKNKRSRKAEGRPQFADVLVE